MNSNPLCTIISLVSEKASTLPTLPFDIVTKIAYHYIQENPKTILDTYHCIQKHISKKEKQSLILECFEKIYEEHINECYDSEWESEMWEDETRKETRQEMDEREERNLEKDYSTSLLDLVIYKSRKDKQILKNFSEMIFEIKDFLVVEEIRKRIVSKNSIHILPFEKHNLFSLDLLKILYINEEKGFWNFLKVCSASNVEIFKYLLENED